MASIVVLTCALFAHALAGPDHGLAPIVAPVSR